MPSLTIVNAHFRVRLDHTHACTIQNTCICICRSRMAKEPKKAKKPIAMKKKKQKQKQTKAKVQQIFKKKQKQKRKPTPSKSPRKRGNSSSPTRRRTAKAIKIAKDKAARQRKNGTIPKATWSEVVEALKRCKLLFPPTPSSICNAGKHSGKRLNSKRTWVPGKKPFDLYDRWKSIVLGSSREKESLVIGAKSSRDAYSVFSRVASKMPTTSWMRKKFELLKFKPASIRQKTDALVALSCKVKWTAARERCDQEAAFVAGCRPFNMWAFFCDVKRGATKSAYALHYTSFVAAAGKFKKGWAGLQAKKLMVKNKEQPKTKLQKWKKELERQEKAAAVQATKAANARANAIRSRQPKGLDEFVVIHATIVDIAAGANPNHLLPNQAPGYSTAPAVWGVATTDIASMENESSRTSRSKEQLRKASIAARSHALSRSNETEGDMWLYKINYSHSSVQKWHPHGCCGQRSEGMQRPMVYSHEKIDLRHSVAVERWHYKREGPNTRFMGTTWTPPPK